MRTFRQGLSHVGCVRNVFFRVTVFILHSDDESTRQNGKLDSTRRNSHIFKKKTVAENPIKRIERKAVIVCTRVGYIIPCSHHLPNNQPKIFFAMGQFKVSGQ